jgi:hypothetical protein
MAILDPGVSFLACAPDCAQQPTHNIRRDIPRDDPETSKPLHGPNQVRLGTYLS